MKNLTNMFVCSNIGLSPTTEVKLITREDGTFEARQGFAMMGQANMTEQQFKDCNHDPFHEKFYDNFATAHGLTEDEAKENLQRELKGIAETLHI